MATTDTIGTIQPRDFFVEDSPYNGAIPVLSLNGIAAGVRMPPRDATALNIIKRFPSNASLVTGATVKIEIADDPNGPGPASKVVKLGINFGVMGTTSAYVAPTVANLGTEATGTVTMPATLGLTIEVSIAIAVANMASCAASKCYLFRLRRLGNDASDTDPNWIIVHTVTILDT